MAMHIAVGYDQSEDAYEAGVLACQGAIKGLAGKPANFLLVFASVAFDQEKMLSGVRSVEKDALLLGCSTAGEITKDGPLATSSVAVMAIHSDDVNFFGGVGEDIAKDAREAGKKVAEAVLGQLPQGELPTSFIMLPDVLVGNGASIVTGVLDVLGKHFPVVGGAAGDDFQFKKTYQYLNGTVYSGTVVGVGLTGPVKFGIGVRHGWTPIGLPMKVTRSEGSVLHMVNDKPAIDVYDVYFGDYAKELRTDTLAKLAITYPLGIRVAESDEYLIRDPISVDAAGSITCAAEIPEGSEIRLMMGGKQAAIAMAKMAAENALKQLEGAPAQGAIIFNCIARKKLFGEMAGDEIAAIQEVIGRDTPLLGFYTYGEQAPLNGEVKNIEQCNAAFHNETIVIYLLGA
ncbi:MAG: hypothetical protein A3E38_00285 [Candidatus Moranbacteria bacterium RIFCSPHIGHO2_12_FULL_54_9]|nr:MAG: hypothetical protein A2878_02160 [Candidatus Moranbacteria bacterium RIFCSPHIGHO2_01_FULL_54_31]OGI25974.1 MAG: hypothetical protein A3E38_00285 [Candidatus Moranbacteria bacterium RIFCSPHIGHO2_12_FULL_54_9]